MSTSYVGNTYGFKDLEDLLENGMCFNKWKC